MSVVLSEYTISQIEQKFGWKIFERNEIYIYRNNQNMIAIAAVRRNVIFDRHSLFSP
jgi:hypothetical protein